MGATFEERVGEELDALWAGALFLADRDADGAEALLTAALTGARQAWIHRGPQRHLGRFLRARLAGAAQRIVEGRGSDRSGGVPKAAGRAALWLVGVERWRYAEAADALELSPADLRTLLHQQRTWVRDLWRAGGGENPAATRGPGSATDGEGVG